MPIKPIDLQTLFTQMDRVSRERAAETQAAAAQQSLAGAETQKKAEQTAHSVQKTEESKDEDGQGVAIKDDEASKRGKDQQASGEKKKDGDEGDEAEKPDESVIRDPRVGGKIDILG